MTCNTCQPMSSPVRTDLTNRYGQSILGKSIIGRSTAGYDLRTVGDGMYGLGQARSGTIENGFRRLGVPKTEAQRVATHMARYGNANLPPRGAGLVGQQKLEGEVNWGNVFGGVIIGVIFGWLVFSRSGRKVGYYSGQRIAGKIKG